MQARNRNNFAIIFDMDGVIVDSNPFHKKALLQFCQNYGYDLTEEQMKIQIFGRTNKDWLTNLFEDISPAKMRELEEEKEGLFREIYSPFIKPVEGLIAFLEMLEENKIVKAIATSAPNSNVKFTLEKTGVKGYFQTIVTGDSIVNSKPHPEIYLKAMQAIGFSQENCIVIEDSLSGVEAARRAGCKVIGITTTHGRKELDSTDMIVDDFSQIELKDLEKLSTLK